MVCKPNYLYVNGFLEIIIVSEPKKKNFSYSFVQKKIEDKRSAVAGATREGKYFYSASRSKRDLLAELQKNFTSEQGIYHVTNLFDVCSNGGFVTLNAIRYTNIKSNTIENRTISKDNGILLKTNNKRCILSEIKYDKQLFKKINNLGRALCK
jgi:hypothetical protein